MNFPCSNIAQVCCVVTQQLAVRCIVVSRRIGYSDVTRILLPGALHEHGRREGTDNQTDRQTERGGGGQ